MTDWITKPGNAIDIGIELPWLPVSGNSVDIDFNIPYCYGRWGFRLPNDIEFVFLREWEERLPDDIEFMFTCEGPDTEPEFTFFDGFFEAHEGSWCSSTLFITQNFQPRGYTGEVGSATLGFTFKFTGYTGELGAGTLTTYPSPAIALEVRTGETGSGELSASYALQPRAYTGESGAGALATESTLYPAGYAGETGTGVLDARPAWLPTFRAYTGEMVDSLLSTGGTLGEVNAQTGETFVADVVSYPAALIEATARSGETGATWLASESTLTVRAYTGEAGTLSLNIYPAPNIEVNGYNGETFTFTLQTSQQLGLITARSGDNASLTLGNEPNLLVYTGENGSFNLATETLIPVDLYGGETGSLSLKTGPSEPLGLFRGYTGESVQSILITLPSAVLNPNPITMWSDVIVGFDTATSFDLLRTTCCPKIGSHELVELNEMEPTDIKYSGTKIVVQADLSTRPRFYLNAYAGESFAIVDPNWFTQLNGATGQRATLSALVFEENNFNLCYGNLIPDSEFADAELMSLENWNCEAHVAYAGEYSTLVTLQNNVQPEPRIGSGETFEMVLTTDPAWLLFVYSGEHAKWANTEVTPRAQTGESATVSFYAPPYTASVGQSATLVGLTTEYNVEFLELGCLDNEFLPADEDGDPDPDNANPVPVELDFFVHSIKARCF